VLPIKFPSPFHQISPIVCKASFINYKSFSLFRSNLTLRLICTTSAFGSFFFSWLVSFNLPFELHPLSSESVTNRLVHPLMNTFKNFGLNHNSFNPFSPFVQLAFNSLIITRFLSIERTTTLLSHSFARLVVSSFLVCASLLN
jgi:hypothetical protein